MARLVNTSELKGKRKAARSPSPEPYTPSVFHHPGHDDVNLLFTPTKASYAATEQHASTSQLSSQIRSPTNQSRTPNQVSSPGWQGIESELNDDAVHEDLPVVSFYDLEAVESNGEQIGSELDDDSDPEELPAISLYDLEAVESSGGESDFGLQTQHTKLTGVQKYWMTETPAPLQVAPP